MGEGSATEHGTRTPAATAGVLERFTIQVSTVIRFCRREDLDALQWFGMFSREHLEDVFARHERGDIVMLVAEAGATPSGQIWIDLARDPNSGFLWSFRVFPSLQGHGIGKRLVRAAERLLVSRGRPKSITTVELDNTGSRRLFESLGYRAKGKIPVSDEEGEREQWVLSRDL